MKNLFFFTTLIILACSCGNEKKGREEHQYPEVTIGPADTSKKENPAAAPSGQQPGDTTRPAIIPADTSAVQDDKPENHDQYVYSGLMVFRDNVGEFVECKSQKKYYINDLTKELRGKYYSFGVPANAGLYTEVVAWYGKAGKNAPKKYTEQVNITHLNRMERTVPYECGGALNKLQGK